jgi:hypothetical protein
VSIEGWMGVAMGILQGEGGKKKKKKRRKEGEKKKNKKKKRRRKHSPPRPLLNAPSPWLPSTPYRTISPSTYCSVLSCGVMLPAPPRPCDTSAIVALVRCGWCYMAWFGLATNRWD